MRVSFRVPTYTKIGSIFKNISNNTNASKIIIYFPPFMFVISYYFYSTVNPPVCNIKIQYCL